MKTKELSKLLPFVLGTLTICGCSRPPNPLLLYDGSIVNLKDGKLEFRSLLDDKKQLGTSALEMPEGGITWTQATNDKSGDTTELLNITKLKWKSGAEHRTQLGFFRIKHRGTPQENIADLSMAGRTQLIYGGDYKGTGSYVGVKGQGVWETMPSNWLIFIIDEQEQLLDGISISRCLDTNRPPNSKEVGFEALDVNNVDKDFASAKVTCP